MEKLKTVDIKGKAYVEVNERIRHFRSSEQYKGYQLVSEITSLEGGVCIIKATILNDQCVVVATGHAYEKENAGFINKTSYIENCETSAWGRALGNLGIGITTSIASSEEVGNAILQQKKQSSQTYSPKITEYNKDKITKLVQNNQIDLPKLLAHYKVKSVDELTEVQGKQIVKSKETK